MRIAFTRWGSRLAVFVEMQPQLLLRNDSTKRMDRVLVVCGDGVVQAGSAQPLFKAVENVAGRN